MPKADSKRLNIRLKTEERFMLEELAEAWACSQTAAMERAIRMAHRGPMKAETSAPARPRSEPVWDSREQQIPEHVGMRRISKLERGIRQKGDPHR